MNMTRHLAISIVLSLPILVTGIAGNMIIEDWRFLEAFYMTIITISTVIAVGKEENLQKLERSLNP